MGEGTPEYGHIEEFLRGSASCNFVSQNWQFELRSEIKALLSKIKELEHVEEFATKNIFFLQGELDKSKTRIEELEESNEGLRDALNLRKGALVQATNGIKQLNEHIKDLVDGIEKYLNDPEFDTDILTKLIEKEKK